MLRIWLAKTGLGIICAWYAGLDPLSAYVSEWIILGGIAFAAGILMLTFGLVGSVLFVLMMVGAIPVAIGYAEHLLARDINQATRFAGTRRMHLLGGRPGSNTIACTGASRTGARGIGYGWLLRRAALSTQKEILTSESRRYLSAREDG